MFRAESRVIGLLVFSPLTEAQYRSCFSSKFYPQRFFRLKTPQDLPNPMRSPFKESLGAFSSGIHLATTKRRSGSYMIHPFLAFSFCPPFVSRTSLAYYNTLSMSSPSVGKGNRLVQSNLYDEEQQNKYWKNGFFIEQEVEENAGKIRQVISNIHNGTVEDIVRRLQSDESCSRIHLSSQLVDALLHKFGEDWKSALGFFRWANLQSDHTPTTYSCDKMVDILGKMRQIDRMWEIVKWMEKGGLVTMETIAKIMRRLAGAGRWKDAIKVFDDLKSWGLDQNTESMNLLLDTLCKEKKTDIAREIYLNLKGQISPNANTFNIFVHGWCNARRIDEAMWTIQEMKDFGFSPSVITYSTIIKAYCKQFKFSRVYHLLDEMVANGCSPNVVTYTIIMHSLAKSRKFEEAISMVEKMQMSGCKPDTHFYNSLINILGLAGQVGEASQIFRVEMQMNGVSRNLSTYNTMISIFCSHDRQEDALGVLKEMEDFSCKPVLHTYIPLLKLCFKTGNLDDQLRMLLGEIVNKHHLSLDLDTYTLLIHGLCNVGKIEWACQLFDDMISREILPKDRTFGLLMCESEQRNMDGVMEKIKCLMKQLDKFPKTEFS